VAGVLFIGESLALMKRLGVGLEELTLHIIQAIQVAVNWIQAPSTLILFLLTMMSARNLDMVWQ
jgi:hypothetical protein